MAGEIGDPRGAVEQRGRHQPQPVLPAPHQLAFRLAVGVRDHGAVVVDEVPHIGGHMHQQTRVGGVAAGRLVDELLPDHAAAQPEGAEQGVQRQAAFGARPADGPGAAAGVLAQFTGPDQRSDVEPQRALHLVAHALRVGLQSRAVRGFALPEEVHQTFGEFGQPGHQRPGGAVQHREGLRVGGRAGAATRGRGPGRVRTWAGTRCCIAVLHRSRLGPGRPVGRRAAHGCSGPPDPAG